MTKVSPALVLPACPLCGAKPLTTSWRFATELDHDCNCFFAQEAEYTRAMKRLWQDYRAKYLVLQDIPESYRHCTLENYQVKPGNKSAWQSAQTLQKGQFLYLYGPSRSGKTHLGIGTIRQLAEQGYLVKMWGEVELFKAFYASVQYNEPLPDPTTHDVLLLDDLGKIKPSEFVYSQIYGLIEHYHAHNKTLIITSNYDPLAASTRLSRSDPEAAEPIAARLAKGTVVKVG